MLMEIVAFDTDIRADDATKTAGITWISKDLLNTKYKMYSKSTVPTAGWENTMLRTFLNNTVKPLIPETVRNSIVKVRKVQYARNNTTEAMYSANTVDDVWIPGVREVYSTYNAITIEGGISYSDKFNDNASRVKTCSGESSFWWLRTTRDANNFFCISTTGSVSFNAPTNVYGIALGFCTN